RGGGLGRELGEVRRHGTAPARIRQQLKAPPLDAVHPPIVHWSHRPAAPSWERLQPRSFPRHRASKKLAAEAASTRAFVAAPARASAASISPVPTRFQSLIRVHPRRSVAKKVLLPTEEARDPRPEARGLRPEA